MKRKNSHFIKFTLPFFLARRYLTAKWSLMSTLSIVIISFGIITLITVISIMNGFHSNFRRKILETNTYHIILQSYGSSTYSIDNIKSILTKNKEIISIVPYYDGEGILKSQWVARGVLVKVIPKNILVQDSGFAREIKVPEGKFDISTINQIVVGEELAHEVGIEVGDKIALLTFRGEEMSSAIPSSMIFTVTGLFKTGYWDYDRSMVYVSLEAGYRLFGISPSDLSIGIKVSNIFKVDRIVRWIQRETGINLSIRTWMEINRPLFEALKNEKVAIGFVVFLIIISGAFNIIGSLIMTIFDKKKEIGILRTLGATPSLITRVFILNGLYIGVIGTVIGTISGIFITIHIQKIFSIFESIVNFFESITNRLFLIPLGVEPLHPFHLLSQSVYYIEGVPVEIHFFDIFIISLLAVVISLVASYYPAKKASETKPVETIRYE